MVPVVAPARSEAAKAATPAAWAGRSSIACSSDRTPRTVQARAEAVLNELADRLRGSGRRGCASDGRLGGRPAQHDQIADRYLHRFAVLIPRRGFELDHSLGRARFRRPHLEHLGLDVKLVARPYRQRPAEFVEARADDAAGRLEIALDQQPHREGRGMPPTGGQSAEYRPARGIFVLVKSLRVEFRRKSLDAVFLHADAARPVDLARRKVLEVPFAHVAALLSRATVARHGHVNGPNQAPPATAAALISPNATSARLCAMKTCERSPFQRSASPPRRAAMARRARLAMSGHSRRPAPWEAKYSASASPNIP